MNLKDKENLLKLLDQCYKEKAEKCNYDCYNCDYGVMEGYGYGHTCSIEVVGKLLGEELYYFKQQQG